MNETSKRDVELSCRLQLRRLLSRRRRTRSACRSARCRATASRRASALAVSGHTAQRVYLIAFTLGTIDIAWTAIGGDCTDPSGLLANQSQHVLTSLEARPPDRIVPGGVALQTKRRIVRDERAHRFDAAAAKHRTVGSVECAGRDRTRQRRGSVFVLDGRVCSVGEQQFEDGGIRVAGRQEQRRQARAGAAVQVGAAIEKNPDGGRLPLENRVLQRRRVPVVSRGSRQVHVGAGIEEEVDRVDRSRPRGPDQRRPRVAALIGFMAIVEELAKGGDVVANGGLGQRSFGTLSAGARREQRDLEPEQKHETVHDSASIIYKELYSVKLSGFAFSFYRNNRPAAARTGAIRASVSRADLALALRMAFQSPPARL